MAQDTSTNAPPVVTFSPALLRAAFEEAADDLVRLAGTVGEDQWDQPGLGVWSVRDLTGHASRALLTLGAYLDTGAGRGVELNHPFEYFAAYRTSYADPKAIAERARQSGLDLGPDPHEGLSRMAGDAKARLRQAGDDDPVASPAGVMRLIDYVANRVYELTVHTGDLATALDVPFTARPNALTVASVFTAALAASAPGGQAVLQAVNGRGPLPKGYSAI